MIRNFSTEGISFTNKMDQISLIFIAVFLVLVSLWLALNRNSKKRLPGPMGWPIIGSLPIMTKKPYVELTELSKKYGPVYKLRLGSIDIVVLTEYETIKEAFSKDAFMGRPPDLPFELSKETLSKLKHLMACLGKNKRRFSLHMLRDLGFGKTRLEEHLKEEILELLEQMSENVGKPVKLSYLLAPSMSNNIASLVFGKRLKYDDPVRQNLDRQIRELGRLAGAVSWQLFFPWIRAFMSKFNIGDNGKMVRLFGEMKDFCRKQIDQHEATLDPNNIRDFVDGYLLEMKKKGNDPKTTFRKEVLTDLSRAFFGAGSDTVRVTVDWMMLISSAYPEVQKKIHAEIDEVIGHERFPTWQDRLNMPYTDAALAELMRWKTIVPLNIMRYTLEDTELNGYFIPKHSRVLAVIWAVDHDKKLWGEDVHEYKPERFLSEDGKKVVKPEYAIPFSVGKRSCPGKSFAEVEVFLYITAILQKFQISAPPGKDIDLEGKLGISLQPKRQELYLKRRQ